MQDWLSPTSKFIWPKEGRLEKLIGDYLALIYVAIVFYGTVITSSKAKQSKEEYAHLMPMYDVPSNQQEGDTRLRYASSKAQGIAAKERS